jgi:hypothetical protein
VEAASRGTGVLLEDEAAILLRQVSLRFEEAPKSLPGEEDSRPHPA